jgi:hypothetical protein
MFGLYHTADLPGMSCRTYLGETFCGPFGGDGSGPGLFPALPHPGGAVVPTPNIDPVPFLEGNPLTGSVVTPGTGSTGGATTSPLDSLAAQLMGGGSGAGGGLMAAPVTVPAAGGGSSLLLVGLLAIAAVAVWWVLKKKKGAAK